VFCEKEKVLFKNEHGADLRERVRRICEILEREYGRKKPIKTNPLDTLIARIKARRIKGSLSRIMEENIPEGDIYAFHLNLIEHGRKICTARKPKCDACVCVEGLLSQDRYQTRNQRIKKSKII